MVTFKYTGPGKFSEMHSCLREDCVAFCLDNLKQCRGINFSRTECKCVLFDEQIYANVKLVVQNSDSSFYKIYI